jgi:glycosyltransferase involved in cell wall biosynthesis
MSPARRVALFLPSLNGGGAERVLLALAEGFTARGIAVDLVLAKAVGDYSGEVPASVRVVNLRAGRVLTSLPRLVHYLRAERPAVLLTTMSHANLVGLWARRLAGGTTRVVIREANTLSMASQRGRGRNKLLPLLVRRYYPWADEIVAVSNGVAEDLSEVSLLPRSKIRVLPNPVITPDLKARAAEPLEDLWLSNGAPPVILGVGRLDRQKDFPTLVRAFAAVRRQREARLIILGEGPERERLKSLLRELELSDHARLPGFVSNPFSYMARAAVFVLSSAWEGMPGALIQGMACGAPVVATDCESGPREVLAGGKFGRLVPVGDQAALADAIVATLDSPRIPLPPEALEQYTGEGAVERYLHLLGIPTAHV